MDICIIDAEVEKDGGHLCLGNTAWAPIGREGRSQEAEGPPARSRGPDVP